MTVKGPGGRKKVHEISEKDVLVEIWLKRRNADDRAYFDFTVSQLYEYEGQEQIGEFVQFRYMNATMAALIKVQDWIHNNKDKYYKDMDESK